MNEGAPKTSENNKDESPKNPSRRGFLGMMGLGAAAAVGAGIAGKEKIGEALNAIGEDLTEGAKKRTAENIEKLERNRSRLKTLEEVVRADFDRWTSLETKIDPSAQHHEYVVINMVANSFLLDVDDFDAEVKKYNNESIKPYEFTLLKKEEIDRAREWGKKNWDKVRRYKPINGQ